MTHPLELEFLTICQAVLGKSWTPDITLGDPIMHDDGTMTPTLLNAPAGRREVNPDKPYGIRYDRTLLVTLAAATIRERSRKIRGNHGRSLAA